MLKDLKIKLLPDGSIRLNGEDVSSAIRANEVSMGASIVSQYAKVRSFLVAQQREMAKGGGVILDGRDIGTVVLPEAELKIYEQPRFSYCFDYILPQLPKSLSDKLMVQNPMRMLSCK